MALVAAQRPVAAAGLVEPQRLEERGARLRARGERAHALEAEQRVLGWDVGRLGGERFIVRARDHQLVPEPLEVGERKPPVRRLGRDAVIGQAGGPERERVLGRDPPLDGVNHAVAGLSQGRARELEERQDRAGSAALVAEVQVVDIGLVEVDGLLDQAEPEQARVEVDVARSIGGDRGDVMEAFESHGQRFSPFVVR
jgi:hypothetical protein